jgi:hypothetical protein
MRHPFRASLSLGVRPRRRVRDWFSAAWVRYSAGLALIAALVASRYGVVVGLVSAASLLCGFWVWFYGVKTIVRRAFGRAAEKQEILFGVIGVLGSVVVCAQGYAVSIALVVGCCALIDGVLLRFKG